MNNVLLHKTMLHKENGYKQYNILVLAMLKVIGKSTECFKTNLLKTNYKRNIIYLTTFNFIKIHENHTYELNFNISPSIFNIFV